MKKAETVEEMQDQLAAFLEQGIDPNNIELLNQKAKQIGIAPCAYAALDIALWDWKAKKPNYRLISYSISLGLQSQLLYLRDHSSRSGQRKNSTDAT